MLFTVGPIQLNVKALPLTIYLFSVCLLIFLGFWQLSRGEVKALRAVDISLANQSSPVALDSLLPEVKHNDWTKYQDVKVRLSGRVLNQHIWFIENKIVRHQLGVDCIVAFQIYQNGADVAKPAQVILINLGWLPVDENRLPIIPIGFKFPFTEFDARIQLPTNNIFMSEKIWQRHNLNFIQQVNIREISKQAKLKLLPILAVVDEKIDSAFTPNWQPIVMTSEKHYGYALQWFGLALALSVITIIKAAKWRTVSASKHKLKN